MLSRSGGAPRGRHCRPGWLPTWRRVRTQRRVERGGRDAASTSRGTELANGNVACLTTEGCRRLRTGALPDRRGPKRDATLQPDGQRLRCARRRRENRTVAAPGPFRSGASAIRRQQTTGDRKGHGVDFNWYPFDYEGKWAGCAGHEKPFCATLCTSHQGSPLRNGKRRLSV